MHSQHIQLATDPWDYWGPKIEKVENIITLEDRYALIPMLLVIVPLMVYLIVNHRFERFEWTILVLMTLKYIMSTLDTTEYIHDRLEDSEFHSQYHTFFIMWWTLKDTLGPICHWIYASQYLKTCFLASGIV